MRENNTAVIQLNKVVKREAEVRKLLESVLWFIHRFFPCCRILREDFMEVDLSSLYPNIHWGERERAPSCGLNGRAVTIDIYIYI